MQDGAGRGGRAGSAWNGGAVGVKQEFESKAREDGNERPELLLKGG